MRRFYAIVIGVFLFLYGAGMGRYQWPPFKAVCKAKQKVVLLLKSALHQRDGRRVEVDLDHYRWELLTRDAAYAPRDGAGALVFKDNMYLIGGWNPNDKEHFPRVCSNDVWKSKNGIEWIKIKLNTFLDVTFDAKKDWEGRHRAGYVIFHDQMWIVGGDANQGYHQYDIWKSSNGMDWSPVSLAKPPWAPRVLMSVFVHDNKLYVLGGQSMDRFFTNEDRWIRKNPPSV